MRKPLHPALADIPRDVRKLMNACRIWRGTVDAKGYPRWTNRGRSLYAHRSEYEYFWGALAPGERVYRTCGERLCTNVFHMTTTNPNVGLKRRRPGTAKLTPRKVRAIRAAWARPDRPSQSALARRYHVSRSAISLVVRGITWADVPSPVAPGCTADVAPAVAPVPLSPLDVLRSRMTRTALTGLA